MRDAKKEYGITKKNGNEEITEYLTKKVRDSLGELKLIVPIKGEMYSYKKDSVWCESALEFGNEPNYSIKQIQNFLNIYKLTCFFKKVYIKKGSMFTLCSL